MNKIFKKNRGLCALDLCSDPPQTLELWPVHFFLAYVMVQYSSANMIRFLVFDHKEKKNVAWGNTLSSVRPQPVLDCANYCLKDPSFSKEFRLIKLTSLTFMTQKCVK